MKAVVPGWDRQILKNAEKSSEKIDENSGFSVVFGCVCHVFDGFTHGFLWILVVLPMFLMVLPMVFMVLPMVFCGFDGFYHGSNALG